MRIIFSDDLIIMKRVGSISRLKIDRDDMMAQPQLWHAEHRGESAAPGRAAWQ